MNFCNLNLFIDIPAVELVNNQRQSSKSELTYFNCSVGIAFVFNYYGICLIIQRHLKGLVEKTLAFLGYDHCNRNIHIPMGIKNATSFLNEDFADDA